MLKSRSTRKAKAGETCHDCGKAFREGERVTGYWALGELYAVMCRNTVACEKRMARARPRATALAQETEEDTMTGITAKKGTVKHMAAMGTLTFDGITCKGGLDKFTDLGLPQLWDAYQALLRKLDYWHRQYIKSGPHNGQTFETWYYLQE